jgi:hypothetical protein
VFTKFTYAGNNIITVKGCSGVAVVDLSTSDKTEITFPDIEHLIYTDIRDGQIFVDDKKQVYFAAGTYEDLSRKFVYKYNGTGWSVLEGYYPVGTMSVFAADQAGNIYYNASDGAGESIRGAVKIKVTSHERKALSLPLNQLLITDAAAISNNTLLLIVEGDLYEHDITAGTTVKTSLSGVNHINILSDGRLLAGGADVVYLSSDEGKSWAGTTKVFSSVDATKDAAAVSRSRIVNGKIILDGVYAYFYDNLTLGLRQSKYDNVAVEFDGGKSTKLPYTFPGDFQPQAIGTDGVIYGFAVLQFDFQSVTDVYELKPNVASDRLPEGTSPQVIADSGLQMSVRGAQNGGLEVMTRNSSSEEWKSTNTPLPALSSGGSVDLRLSGDRLLVIHGTELYISGN